MVKREKWTEFELFSLPSEEPDEFDRKAGKLFDDQGKFLDSVAKALSAFANSGGGSLIIGVNDDGTPDGLPMFVGKTRMRDWIEQKIPNLLEFPLSDFRVHTVIKDDLSIIPVDRDVIIIDVGDSAAAPHQSKRDHIYYYRVGGRSVPASHFYLELLRQRLSNPALVFNLIKIDVIDANECDNGIFVETELLFNIKNVGRVASYHWNLSIREWRNTREGVLPERKNDYYFNVDSFPVKKGRSGGIPINTIILPECNYFETKDFGFQIRPKEKTLNAVSEDIRALLSDTVLFFKLATETSPGELQPIELAPQFIVEQFESEILKKCPQFFTS